jgi:biotin transport system substrate-specific component
MSKAAVNTLNPIEAQPLSWPMQAVVVVSASLFVALCARITVPLPFTPVPLTLQNFAVLLVGMVLGSRRGFAVLALYLFEGATGMPVFNPTGPGGIAQLLGPTGGFLMAYPVVAFVAGWLTERAERTFLRSALAGLAAEVWLFAGGLGWLVYLTHSAGMALRLGLYWFLFAEVIKILLAARVSTTLRRNFRVA